MKFLAERKEFRLLEWLVVYTGDTGALDALQAANAPEWVRAAVWAFRQPDSHNAQASSGVLDKRPGLVLAWFEAHPKGAIGRASAVRDRFAEADPEREDASALLPPLDPAVVFRLLRPPDKVVAWDKRTRALGDEVYVHQVTRTIHALNYSGLHVDPWLERVAGLIDHTHPVVRRDACLAWTNLPRDRIPYARLAARLEAPRETAAVIEAALMALSYVDHPRVELLLLGYAGKPNHAAWAGAVSRLGEIGDGFADAHLASLDDKKLSWAHREAVAEARKAIGPRIPFSGDDVRAAVTAALVRLAWARSSGDALADPIDAWTGRWLRRTFARNAVGPVLRQLSIGYAPAAKWSVEDRERLRTAVPAAARAMWTALQGGEK